jgi:hypothetical protein
LSRFSLECPVPLRISGTPFTPGETGIVQTQIKKTQKTKTAKHTYIAGEPVWGAVGIKLTVNVHVNVHG